MLCLSFQSIWIHLDIKYVLPQLTFRCYFSSSLPLLAGQSSSINSGTTQFSNLSLGDFVELWDIRFCQQVWPRWAVAMFQWMTKNSKTNNTYDDMAASLLNSAVYIESPWWRMSRMIPKHWPLQANIHWSSPSIKTHLQSKVTQITNKETFSFESYHNFKQWSVPRFWIRLGGRNWKAW